MASGVLATASGSVGIDALLYGTKWDSENLSFGFPAAAADVTGYTSNPDPAQFVALTAAEQIAFRAALGEWAKVANLTFTEVAAPGADLRFYRYEDIGNFTARTVAHPGATAEAGDIQLGVAASGDFTAGRYAYFLLLHEIGHTLGLKHPHQTANGFPAADSSVDGVANSVMSYRSVIGGPTSGYTIASGSYPTGLMADDITAIQHLYGPNWAQLAGDTIYSFDPTAPVVFLTLWDGGGDDTLSFAAYSTNLQIDLAPGGWSKLGGQTAVLDNSVGTLAPGNVRMSYLYQDDSRSLIENARGGAGDDQLAGNRAANLLQGAGGDDTLSGLEGADTLQGEAGDDSLAGGAGADSLDGGDDQDRLQGEDGADTLSGGAGADLLEGGAGDDRLTGGDGADTLIGGDGADTLIVGDGDFIVGFAAQDRIIAPGLDPATATLSLAGVALTIDPDGPGGAASFTVTLSGFIGGGPTPTLQQSGDIVLQAPPAPPPPAMPSEGNDLLTAGDAPVSAGAGADLVFGLSGPNWIHGNQGNDQLRGGGGGDTLLGGQGDDLVWGDDDADVLFGDLGADRLDSGSGDDRLQGNRGQDTIYGGSGQDTAHGGQDGDLLQGNEGADLLVGDLGNDTLHGGKGDDLLLGGTGSDWLSGDLGSDTLIGGDGADIFSFAAGSGRAVVTDFVSGAGDRLHLAGATASDIAAVLQSAIGVGADTMLTFGDHTIILSDVQVGSLTSGDFLFP
mgnify:CR=1 FL=1